MIYTAYINELEERSYQHVSFDMEDWSFVYFTAKDKRDEIEIKICLESENIILSDKSLEDAFEADRLAEENMEEE